MDTTITSAPIGSLRQRMLQDMKLRGLGAHTQHATCDPSPRFWAALPIRPAQKTSDVSNSISIAVPSVRQPSMPQYQLCASSSP